MGPFLFSALWAMVLWGFIQLFFRLGACSGRPLHALSYFGRAPLHSADVVVVAQITLVPIQARASRHDDLLAAGSLLVQRVHCV
jgi:hypothetical protein